MTETYEDMSKRKVVNARQRLRWAARLCLPAFIWLLWLMGLTLMVAGGDDSPTVDWALAWSGGFFAATAGTAAILAIGAGIDISVYDD